MLTLCVYFYCREAHPALATAALVQAPSSQHGALCRDLGGFEERLIAKNFKIGVLYWQDGETEDDMYRNGKKKIRKRKRC